MPEIGTFGLMSEDGKRGVAKMAVVTAPILDSTGTSIAAMQRFGSDRANNGHRADIAKAT